MNRTLQRWTSLAGLACLSALSMASLAQAQQVYPTVDPKLKPTADSFYISPSSSELAAATPGHVLRYRALPATSLGTSVKEGWQLMYRSTNTKDQPVAMVTTVLIPKTAPATGRKLLSYQSFYDSLTLDCSPSGQATSNSLLEKTFFQSALNKGYVVTMADYEGLESQWIVAKNSGQGVLDGIRATQRFSKAGLNAQTPVGMLGYSGGGFATAWAAELAAGYAPELKIIGAAQGGLPVNPINVAKKVDGTFWAGAYLGAVVGLSRAYPEIKVEDYATPEGIEAIKDIGTRCLTGTPNLLTAYAYKEGADFLKDPNFLDLPEMQAINRDNTMGKFTPKMPLYVFESIGDQLMPIADVDNLVSFYCANRATVQYKRVAGTDHVLGALGLSGGLTYLLDRFDGKVAPNTCK
ncbi:MAG TPA: lipase family protein [Aquabacterium sp.]|uniref:lipase family protein n=1 Tax=Aquabacterium sp. TaxID=1872578 RepID=UPI002E31B543|nr:lipase family protein [Aquabacterium sp.]HEX5372644.1 lipase family protein [Aquabacterium sp.]